jgi:hypothetical protein
MGAPDPHQLHPGDLPTPFTSDEIRASCQPGRQLRFRVERMGQQPIIHVTRYVGGDEQAALQESWDESTAGERLGEPERSRETWLELQAHASFPADSTEMAEESLEIPAGTFACLRYTQTVDDGLRIFWFARDLPGQPIGWEIRAGGRVVLTVVALENTPPT